MPLEHYPLNDPEDIDWTINDCLPYVDLLHSIDIEKTPDLDVASPSLVAAVAEAVVVYALTTPGVRAGGVFDPVTSMAYANPKIKRVVSHVIEYLNNVYFLTRPFGTAIRRLEKLRALIDAQPAADSAIESAVESVMLLVAPEVDDCNLANARALVTLLVGYVFDGGCDGTEELIGNIEYGWPQVFVTTAEAVRFMRIEYGSDPDQLARIEYIAEKAKLS